MKNQLQELYALEQLAQGQTCVHRLHPLVKLLSAIIFIITVASFNRYALAQMIPCVFYPTLLMALSETPYRPLLKRLLIALPFCLLAGLGNIIYDSAAALQLGGFTISYGALSLLVIFCRAYLCVMAVLLLVSVTPLAQLTNELRRLKIPGILVLSLEMTYRYLGVLMEEAGSMLTAYRLRGGSRRGVNIRHMGSFIGQLLLRSLDRAERVYAAMQCRGYSLSSLARGSGSLQMRDAAFLLLSCLFCLLCRLVNISTLLYGAAGGF